MNVPLRLLIIEDSDRDVALEVRALEAAGYLVTHAVPVNAAEMKAALAKQAFDIIIADHDLPQFDAPGALAVLKESGLDIPFIVVSGAIGEEEAVALIKAGAHDFIMKDRPSRLASAVEHALKDAENQRGRKRMVEELRQSEEKYRKLFENMSSSFALHEIITDKSGAPVDYIFLEVNPAFEKMTGLQQKDIIGKRVTEALPGTEADPADWIGTYGKVALDGEPIAFERYSENMAKWYSVVAYSPGARQFATIFADISERKRGEEALRMANLLLRMDVVARDSNDAITVQDLQGRILAWNPGAMRMYGWSESEALAMNMRKRIPKEQAEKELALLKKIALDNKMIFQTHQTQRLSKDGRSVDVWVTASSLINDAGELYAISTTERKID